MTYEVVVTRRARRDLAEHLPAAAAAACLEFLRGDLAANPRRVGKPLRGELEGLHSARRGVFRVIYRIDDGRVVVEVIHIAHRRDVYR